jgi:RHS repeat-associated protein
LGQPHNINFKSKTEIKRSLFFWIKSESTFGLHRINFGFRSYNPTIGLFDGADLLGDINEAYYPMAYVNGDPVNNIDIDGLYASNTFDGKPLGDGGGRVPGAPEEEKPKPKAPTMDFATWGALQFARLEVAITSNGPAYSEMGPTRRALNDFANSSFIKTANEWNPLYQGVNALSGTLTGKDVYGKQMGKGGIALAALGMIPGGVS